MKIRRADRGSLRALFLLSSRYSASRCRRYRVAALVRLPEAFLRVCRLLFRRGISERPSGLDRQRRTPTKGRIQNTPIVRTRAVNEPNGQGTAHGHGIASPGTGPAGACQIPMKVPNGRLIAATIGQGSHYTFALRSG